MKELDRITYNHMITQLHLLGIMLTGQYAQSRVLTEIGNDGNRKFQKAQKITGYEIIETYGEPTLMLIIDGNSVLESTLFNINPKIK